MGSKNAFKKQSKHNNVLKINQYQIEKQKDVQIIPRNKNQESYLIKLLDPSKDIVFGVGPAGTGKTLLAVQVAIKMFKQRQVDRIIITRPAVSVDEDIGFYLAHWKKKWHHGHDLYLMCFKNTFAQKILEV